jgi:hypothetical protein
MTTLSGCTLISLDHDLGPVPHRDGDRFDPGIGRTITEALANLPPALRRNVPSGRTQPRSFSDTKCSNVAPPTWGPAA